MNHAATATVRSTQLTRVPLLPSHREKVARGRMRAPSWYTQVVWIGARCRKVVVVIATAGVATGRPHPAFSHLLPLRQEKGNLNERPRFSLPRYAMSTFYPLNSDLPLRSPEQPAPLPSSANFLRCVLLGDAPDVVHLFEVRPQGDARFDDEHHRGREEKGSTKEAEAEG